MKGKGKNKNGIKIKIENTSGSWVASQPSPAEDVGYTEYTSFTNVLQRRDNKDITISDLKAVQYTLEYMLVNGIQGRRQLENKLLNLENLSSKKDKRSKSTDSIDKKEERPPKKAKESTGKIYYGQPKVQFLQTPYNDGYVETRPAKDSPCRFWTIIEPFCADITQDTIRMIEDWIKPEEFDERHQQIPVLGEHYTKKWLVEDIKEELKEGSKSVENNKGLFSDSIQDNEDIERVLKAGEVERLTRDCNQDCSLQDRIVCSLVGENLMTPMHHNLSQACLDDDEKDSRTNPNAPVPAAVSISDTLRDRLMKELIDSDLLDAGAMLPTKKEDELLGELKKLQQALIPVQEHNMRQKQKLLILAKNEMLRQDAKKKLQEFDAKVMEIYRIVAAARKNGTMNKKLEEQVKRTLRERKKLVDKMSSAE